MTDRTVSAATLAFAFSCACFLDALALLISPRHDTVLHLNGPASALFVPVVLNILVLAALCFLMLLATLRFSALHRTLSAGLVALLPWIMTKNVCSLLGIFFPHTYSVSLFLLCCALFFALALMRGSSGKVTRVRSILSFLELSFALVGLLFCVQAVYYGIRARDLNPPFKASASMSTRSGRHSGRVVWIVLDELGYTQVFGDRLQHLALPNFDKLRSQSSLFSEVQPAGLYTEVVLPELMTGLRLTQVSGSPDGKQLILEEDHTSEIFRPGNTVFGDALSLGYRDAVVGWYIPYCRLLSGVLSSCFSTGQTVLSASFPAQTIGRNLVYPTVRFLHKVPYFFASGSGPTPDEIEEGHLHIADYMAIHQAMVSTMADKNNDFILIHAPVPHPEGIWDRSTHSFAIGRSSYVDNLSLADDFLGEIMSILQKQGEWDDSTVLVMGDHAWRTRLLWLHNRSWSPDDEKASVGGTFDPRPAYLVKLPHQQTSATITTPFAELETRALLDQLLRHDLQSPLQLQQFVLTQSQSCCRH